MGPSRAQKRPPPAHTAHGLSRPRLTPPAPRLKGASAAVVAGGACLSASPLGLVGTSVAGVCSRIALCLRLRSADATAPPAFTAGRFRWRSSSTSKEDSTIPLAESLASSPSSLLSSSPW